MAKLNPGLLIVLLLAGFAVLAYAGTKKVSNEPQPSTIPSNSPGLAAAVFTLTLTLIGGLVFAATMIANTPTAGHGGA